MGLREWIAALVSFISSLPVFKEGDLWPSNTAKSGEWIQSMCTKLFCIQWFPAFCVFMLFTFNLIRICVYCSECLWVINLYIYLLPVVSPNLHKMMNNSFLFIFCLFFYINGKYKAEKTVKQWAITSSVRFGFDSTNSLKSIRGVKSNSTKSYSLIWLWWWCGRDKPNMLIQSLP